MIKPEDVVLYKKSGEPGFATTQKNRTSILIRRLIGEAIEVRATDVHIEPESKRVRIRARVDGFLRDMAEYDHESGSRILSAIKVLCDLDITRKNRMQDGSFSGVVRGRPVEFRVSSVEEVFGDKMVIRILETEPEIIDLKRLGLDVKTETDLRLFLTRPQGMLLVSGPTGSGKSTTLYSLLREVDRKQRNVIAIEDPIEYHLEYMTQIPVSPKHGVTFATALRNALRQDPNILMIGEIRDSETAAIAIQSGLTGHLVFSTVHARDSVATIYRLLDLGVEPFLVANVLNMTLAQRLVRMLCRSCKVPHDPDEVKIRPLGRYVKGRIYSPKGCERCEGTGYRGRTGVFEIVRVTEKMRDMIVEKASEDVMRKVAREEGMQPIHIAAMEKVNDGLTSLDELERVLG
ncbi:MAG: type II/IV secretion system protein [Planctomycetes bacterium]|nr:type II/IV secretion system protein [Planctomycetota bacterium]